PESELRSRQVLHEKVPGLLTALSTVDAASLVSELDTVWHTISDLQRHAAYLKVLGLEDTADQTIKRARSAVDTDQSVLEAAVSKRLRSVPQVSIASLGPYRLLAIQAQAEAKHTFSPDAQQYRGEVTLPQQDAIGDAYDKIIESLGLFSEATSSDNTKRRPAIASRDRAFDEVAPETAMLLGTLVDSQNRDAAAQGYPDASTRKYETLGLTSEGVQHVLRAVEAKAPLYRDYEQLLAEHVSKRLNISPVLSTEVNVGIVPESTIPFSQADRLILDALAPLGQDYVHRLAQLLDPANGRLDLAGGRQRAHTGTSIAVFDAPVAFFFGAYDGSIESVDTIAHEGGHAIHRELMNANGIPIFQREGPHYLSEGYAIFNEFLVLDHMVNVARSPAEKERALEYLLKEIAFQIFTSAEETSFERSLYTSAAGHPLLDRMQIDALYRRAVGPYEYWPMTDIGASRAWMRKSLLFEDPLYLVNYLYASLVAVSLYTKAEADPHFANSYEALLKRGFDDNPEVLLSSLGIRLDDPKVIDNVAEVFQMKLNTLKALYAADNQQR
ncbi:MAG: M3 family oligoendopeptidase, partial [Candidatus Eremiobacteraeota bacterium]|nr:M3 family oligoendopeptidase [Candidatus Eremiobacteraeota bacterium]